ncbi:MAG: response regulator [Desulfobulbaceae bacterium]|nr:response regulator [Desulfobulbaceae bacterium]
MSDTFLPKAEQPRILIVDDIAANLRVLSDLLVDQGYQVSPATSGSFALRSIAFKIPDLILLDVRMPEMDGFEVCRRLKADEQSRSVPVIFISASDDMVDKVKGFEVGGVDYITKPFQALEVLARVATHLALRSMQKQLEAQNIQLQQEITERERIEHELREHKAHLEEVVAERTAALRQEMVVRERAEKKIVASEEKYRSLVNNINIGIFRTTFPGQFLQVNPAMAKIFGYASPEQMMENSALDLYREVKDRERLWEEAHAKGGVRNREVAMMKNDGTPLWVALTASVQYDERGTAQWLDGVLEDITERKALEVQLLQAQKMEVLGTLSGGVAHDFNNILTGIIGYGQLLQMKFPSGTPLRTYVDQIMASSERAAHLTKSLLTFSRKRELDTKPTDINTIITNFENFLTMIVGKKIELKVSLDSAELIALADIGQVEQVLMNLATNAKDAMPEGGIFTIKTETMEPDSQFLMLHPSLHPGKHVLISVADSGVGMDENTKRKLFEPFFTTKEEGKGTGLGLSIVYGIIKQHQGEIMVSSERGTGTTFRMYLPLVKSADEVKAVVSPLPPRGRGETILLVESDSGVRFLAKTVLEQSGYAVIEAVDGEDGFRKFTEHMDAVQLLLTELMLPTISGKELYDQVRNNKPDVKALFTSNFTPEIIRKDAIVDEFLFLPKPISPNELARKVRELLDTRVSGQQ